MLARNNCSEFRKPGYVGSIQRSSRCSLLDYIERLDKITMELMLVCVRMEGNISNPDAAALDRF